MRHDPHDAVVRLAVRTRARDAIVGVSGIGRATEAALAFNDARLGGPLGTRHDAILVGRYPPAWAIRWLMATQA